MPETKEFKTVLVSSVSSGFMLAEGMNFGNIQEVAEWVLGHPVWTHELADRDLWRRISEAIRQQIPQIPVLSSINAIKAGEVARALVAELGETVSLTRGSETRSEDPISSLTRLMPGKPVIAVVGPSEEA